MKSVAIDGPSGAGKSTIAKIIAKKLGFIYVDTGALYRAVAVYMLKHNIDTDDFQSVILSLPNISVELKFMKKEQHVFLNFVDVSEEIRKNEVSMIASKISAIPEVRKFLLKIQRSIAEKNNVVMDGRDIGTVVLPEADIKIFLTASPEDRAARRRIQLLANGEDIDYAVLLSEINKRDYNDANRSEAPLKQAADAILVDTTGNELDESVKLLTGIIKENLNICGE